MKDQVDSSPSNFLNPKYSGIYEQLKKSYVDASMLLKTMERSGRLHGMPHAWRKLKLAAKALNNWKLAQKKESGFYTEWNAVTQQIDLVNDIDKKKIDFADRWTYAVFISVSVFATRWLIEASAYETAWEVARISLAHLTVWRDIHHKKNSLSIAPFVFRYARATLYAYKAFCAIQMGDDLETRERLAVEKIQASPNEYVDIADKAIRAAPMEVQIALEILPRHPLAMFVAAHLHRHNKLLEEAALEFNRLAGVISPFDPVDYLANWQMVRKIGPEFKDSTLYREWSKDINNDLTDYEKLNLRERMKLQENVSGRGQLTNLVDKAQIHEQIARVHAEQNKWTLCVNHLMQATVWAMHRDLETEYLLDHVLRLEQLDRFKDAHSVSKILRSRQTQLESQTFSVTKIRQPDIITCTMDSRLKNFSKALDLGYRIYQQWTSSEKYTPIELKEFDITKGSIHSLYKQKLNDQDDLVEFLRQSQQFLDKTITQSSQDNEFILQSRPEADLEILAPYPSGSIRTQTIVFALARNYLVLRKMADLFAALKTEPWIHDHPSEGFDIKGIDDNTIKDLRQQSPKLNISWNISVRLIHVLCQESFQILVQYCQLLNTIVYSRVELNISHISAYPIANATTKLSQNSENLDEIIEISKNLYRFAFGQRQSDSSTLQQNLRNYYDTKGWLTFRLAIPFQHSELQDYINHTGQYEFDLTQQLPTNELLLKLFEAQLLLEEGLTYDPNNSILYYHLARVHLAILERIWQTLSKTETNDVAKIAAIFQDHLRRAASNWRSALNSDSSGRLRAALNWLGQRIDLYSDGWQTRFLSSLRGKAIDSKSDSQQ